MKKITILGTEYTIEQDGNILKSEGADGICERYGKRIILAPKDLMLEDTNDADLKEDRYKEVLRHEVVHAFFAESGLLNYGGNEELVDCSSVS